MTDILFPPGLCPMRVTWSLDRNVGVFESPLSSTAQRVERRSPRWRASVEFPPLTRDDSALLTGWLDQISLAGNCGLLPVFQNDASGTESALPVFADQQVPWFERDANLDWTIQPNLLAPPYVNNRELVAYSAAASGGSPAYLQRTFAAINGLPYAAIVASAPQFTPGALLAGTSGFGTTYADERATLPSGRRVYPFTAASTSVEVRLAPGNAATGFVQSRFSAFSLMRITIAQLTAAAGARSVVAWGGMGMGGSSAGYTVFRGGQFVEIETSAGWELKRLRTDVDMIAGGTLGGNAVTSRGHLDFEPALRGSVAANAAILHAAPVCRMRLAEARSSVTIDAPLFGGFAFEMVEDILV